VSPKGESALYNAVSYAFFGDTKNAQNSLSSGRGHDQGRSRSRQVHLLVCLPQLRPLLHFMNVPIPHGARAIGHGSPLLSFLSFLNRFWGDYFVG